MGINGLLQIKTRSGTIETPVWQAPANLTGNFILRAVMPQDELEDIENGMVLALYTSEDTTTWRYNAGLTWTGGNPYSMDGETIVNGIGVGINGAQVAGKYIKVTLQLNKPQKIGFEVETV